MKRNASYSSNDIQMSQFCAPENEFVQNDAPDAEPEIRKKHKSTESENSAIKVINALPVDENENLTDQQDYYVTRMAEFN